MNCKFSVLLPHEFAAEAALLVEKWQKILPSWVRRVTVCYDRTVSAQAMVGISEVYGYVNLTLGDGWAECDHREAVIVHEFCHCYTIPISRIAREMMEDFFPDGPTSGTRMFDRVVQEANERCTCEMESLILRLMASRDLDSGAQI